MKTVAVLFGLAGAALGILIGLLMVLIVFVLMAFDEGAGAAIAGTAATFLVAGCGFMGAIRIEKQPSRGSMLLAISAGAWTVVALWLLDGEWIFWAPCVACFGIAAALGWMAQWRDRVTEVAPTLL